MLLSQHIARRRVFAARQAERGVIRALRVGKPDAETSFRVVMPIKRASQQHLKAVEMDLARIEIEDQAESRDG